MWFVGDVTNLIGGAWAGLVPVVVAIAVYFCIADGVLIGQCLYYKARNARRAARRRSSLETPDPTTPLLGRRFSDNQTIPGARRRSSASGMAEYPRRVSDAEAALAKIIEEDKFGRNAWVKNISGVLAICVIGIVGWAIAWQSGVWTPAPQELDGGVDMAVGAQILGYISAICYLG